MVNTNISTVYLTIQTNLQFFPLEVKKSWLFKVFIDNFNVWFVWNVKQLRSLCMPALSRTAATLVVMICLDSITYLTNVTSSQSFPYYHQYFHTTHFFVYIFVLNGCSSIFKCAAIMWVLQQHKNQAIRWLSIFLSSWQ